MTNLKLTPQDRRFLRVMQISLEDHPDPDISMQLKLERELNLALLADIEVARSKYRILRKHLDFWIFAAVVSTIGFLYVAARLCQIRWAQ